MTTVGISGTESPTSRMIEALEEAIRALPRGTKLVSGGCIGIDNEATRIAHEVGLDIHTVFPGNKKKVASIARARSTSWEDMLPGTSYRDRNTRVVELSDWLIAVPSGPTNGV